jgi:hypothetical protein
VLSPRQQITGAPYAIQTRGIDVDEDNNVATSADLHVAGEVHIANDHAITGDSGNGIGRLDIARVGPGNELILGHGNNAYLDVVTGGTDGEVSFHISNGGYAIFGGTDPHARLEIDHGGGDVNDPGLQVHASDNQILLTHPDLPTAAGITFNTFAGNPEVGGITFQRRNEDGSWEQNLLTLDLENGHLGIRALHPEHALDVNGEIAVNGDVVIDSNGRWVGGDNECDCPPGPAGPPGPAVSTSAVCVNQGGGNASITCIGICGSNGDTVARALGPCTVTSDTGACSAPPAGACCVCQP